MHDHISVFSFFSIFVFCVVVFFQCSCCGFVFHDVCVDFLFLLIYYLFDFVFVFPSSLIDVSAELKTSRSLFSGHAWTSSGWAVIDRRKKRRETRRGGGGGKV